MKRIKIFWSLLYLILVLIAISFLVFPALRNPTIVLIYVLLCAVIISIDVILSYYRKKKE